MSIQRKIFSTWSDWHQGYKKDTKFNAVMIEGSYRPFDIGDKDVFIYGIGRKKFGKAKRIELSVIDDQTDLQEYLNLYGSDCLFYGLTNQLINNNDCSWTCVMDDFKAMLVFGIDKWIVYVERVKKLKEVVNTTYQQKYGIIANNEKIQTTNRNNIVFRNSLFVVNINHYLMYPFKGFPHFDVINDDSRLCNTFKYCEWLKDGKEDLSIDTSVFPVSVKDRLIYLFNEEVANEYSELMHYFSSKDLVVTE